MVALAEPLAPPPGRPGTSLLHPVENHAHPPNLPRSLAKLVARSTLHTDWLSWECNAPTVTNRGAQAALLRLPRRASCNSGRSLSAA